MRGDLCARPEVVCVVSGGGGEDWVGGYQGLGIGYLSFCLENGWDRGRMGQGKREGMLGSYCELLDRKM